MIDAQKARGYSTQVIYDQIFFVFFKKILEKLQFQNVRLVALLVEFFEVLNGRIAGCFQLQDQDSPIGEDAAHFLSVYTEMKSRCLVFVNAVSPDLISAIRMPDSDAPIALGVVFVTDPVLFSDYQITGLSDDRLVFNARLRQVIYQSLLKASQSFTNNQHALYPHYFLMAIKTLLENKMVANNGHDALFTELKELFECLAEQEPDFYPIWLRTFSELNADIIHYFKIIHPGKSQDLLKGWAMISSLDEPAQEEKSRFCCCGFWSKPTVQQSAQPVETELTQMHMV